MKKVCACLGLAALAAVTAGCAQLEQALSSPTGTGGTGASILGTWTSSSSIGAGLNSCTNFQWKVTGQQGSTVSGEFSAICGSINVSGTVSGQVNSSDVPYQVIRAASPT